MTRSPVRSGIEPSLQDVMTDPIVHQLMRSDGLVLDDLWAVLEAAQGHRLRRPKVLPPPPDAPPSEKAEERDVDDSPLCRASRLCKGLWPLGGAALALVALLAALMGS